MSISLGDADWLASLAQIRQWLRRTTRGQWRAHRSRVLRLNGGVPPVLCPTLLYLLLFVPCLLPSHGLTQRKQSLCHWKHSKRGFRALCEEEEGSPQRPQQRGTHGDVDKSHPLEQPERISIRHEVKSDATGSEDEGCLQVSSTAVNLGGFVTDGSGEGSHQFKRVQKCGELSRSECSGCEIRGVLGTARVLTRDARHFRIGTTGACKSSEWNPISESSTWHPVSRSSSASLRCSALVLHFSTGRSASSWVSLRVRGAGVERSRGCS